jgi:hypothetical protein
MVGYVQCVRIDGHEEPHLFRCAGEFCSGYPWAASNVAHPSSCRIEGLNSPEDLEKAARLRRGELLE